MQVLNCSNHQITIKRDSILGIVEKISEGDQIEEMNVNTLTRERKIEKPEIVERTRAIYSR